MPQMLEVIAIEGRLGVSGRQLCVCRIPRAPQIGLRGLLSVTRPGSLRHRPSVGWTTGSRLQAPETPPFRAPPERPPPLGLKAP